MVKIKQVSLVKTIVFIFFGIGLLYSMYLGLENIALAITSGILGYIAKDAEMFSKKIINNNNEETILETSPGPVNETPGNINDPNDPENFIMG
jgi:hypothetical protein